MMDIKNFLAALKCSWIKRIMDDQNKGQWKLAYKDIINKYGGKLIFKWLWFNERVDIRNVWKNTFIKEIMLYWSTLNKYEQPKDISSQILWSNSNILINKKTIFQNVWFEKGINHISDIYDYRTNTFYSFQKLVNLYDLPINELFFYNQLKSW